MKIKKTYLMSDGQGYTKIGKSVSPQKRESNLKVGNSSIELLAICNKDIESILHIKYKNYLHKGEWFKLSSKQILKIMSDYDFISVEDVTYVVSIDKIEDTEKVNPLIKDLIIETGRRVIDYNKNGGIADENQIVALTYLERSNKISVFVNPVIRLLLCSLSGSAIKLLMWIQQSLDYGSDIIKFNTKRFLKESKMSANTLTKAKKELIEKEIIAVDEDDKKSLWINPIIMFKGNRVKKYPNKVISPIGSSMTSDSKIN